jgi:serine phosphatase RsbU (regulator of sigma subunit)
VQNYKDQFDAWMNSLSIYARHPSDTDEQRLHKAVLIWLAGICTLLGMFWGFAYLALGLSLSGGIPLGYAAVSTISLLYFLRSKRYRIFCRSQLTMILILPILLQWSLGGVAASGAVILWSILSPIGALMFAGTMRAIPWFVAYLVLMILSGLLPESGMPEPRLAPHIVMASFIMNIAGVSAIAFFLLKYFVQAREEAMAALDKEHQKVQHSLSLAMEVQQNLLPKSDPKIAGLDISGRSIYCDETGGDYYDFLEAENSGDGKIGVVVGDVSDHGISSALLMATVRAQIRQCCSVYGTIDQVVTDVNRRLTQDVMDSGRFMTLFYTEIDRSQNIMRWVSAGHDPAIIYDPAKDVFSDLDGAGNLALGVMEDANFKEDARDIVPGQIIVIATDGIWEARNPKGEMFGKERLHKMIRQNASATAKEIQSAVFESIRRFQKDARLEDDMTLVVIKIEE